ncbi:hypothetical protein SUDANB176_06410 [Streptomyces sp. enrichment culture]
MPHPVLLPDLEELRTFAAGLGVVQGVEQLHRATWHKPADVDGAARAVTEFAGAEHRSWFHLCRVTTLRPLAVGPVPGTEAALRRRIRRG